MNALMALGPMMGGVPRAANAMAAMPQGVSAARVIRDPRTGLPMQLPRPAEVYLQGAPTMMRAAPRPLPGVTR
jgi:hypothetical protein